MSKSKPKRNIAKLSITIIALFVMFLSGTILLTSNSTTSADAGLNFCSNLGSGGMKKVNRVDLDVSYPNGAPRAWTMQELFKGSVSLTRYYGEGEETWLYSGTDPNRGSSHALWNNSDVQERIQAQRAECGNFFPISNGLGNINLGIANMLTNFSRVTSSALFGGTFFCTEAGQDGCMIDLVTPIAGDGTNDGLIGSLRDAIYLPFTVLAFTFVAVNLIYNGIWKRKFRESFQNIIWSLLAFILGLAFLYAPTELVTMPTKFTSTISTCTVGALNGVNCLDGSSGAQAISTTLGEECIATVGGQSTTDTLMNGINCGLWRTFVVNPWSLAQFGVPYNELYTMNPPSGGSIWTELPEGSDGSEYCVALGSTNSANSYKGANYVTIGEGDKICNVALYQLYLSTDVVDWGNSSNGGRPVNSTIDTDTRWFNIILPLATNDTAFDTWASPAFSRVGATAAGAFSSLLASLLISFLSLMALVYQSVSVVLMAVAPVMFLMAIHPGKGKKVFLGWVETIVSSVLKFGVSVVYAIIAIAMYNAVMSGASVWGMMIGSIVITVMLWMYREEIINLLGVANMGGTKLSNKLGDSLSKAGKTAQRQATAIAGGAIGNVLASRGRQEQVVIDRYGNALIDDSGKVITSKEGSRALYDDETGELLRDSKGNVQVEKDKKTGFMAGAADGYRRELKRGRGIVAQISRQRDRTTLSLDKRDRDQELSKQSAYKNQMERNQAANEEMIAGLNGHKVDTYADMSDMQLMSIIEAMKTNGEIGTKSWNEAQTERAARFDELNNINKSGSVLYDQDLDLNKIKLSLEERAIAEKLNAKITLDVNRFNHNKELMHLSDSEIHRQARSVEASGNYEDPYFKAVIEEDFRRTALNRKDDSSTEDVISSKVNAIVSRAEADANLINLNDIELRNKIDELAGNKDLTPELRGQLANYKATADIRFNELPDEAKATSVLYDPARHGKGYTKNVSEAIITKSKELPHNPQYDNVTDAELERNIEHMLKTGQVHTDSYESLVFESALRSVRPQGTAEATLNEAKRVAMEAMAIGKATGIDVKSYIADLASSSELVDKYSKVADWKLESEIKNFEHSQVENIDPSKFLEAEAAYTALAKRDGTLDSNELRSKIMLVEAKKYQWKQMNPAKSTEVNLVSEDPRYRAKKKYAKKAKFEPTLNPTIDGVKVETEPENKVKDYNPIDDVNMPDINNFK